MRGSAWPPRTSRLYGKTLASKVEKLAEGHTRKLKIGRGSIMLLTVMPTG
jgi:hypothetical protein